MSCHHTKNSLAGRYFRMWRSNMSIVITALYNSCRPNYDHPASAHAQNPPSLFPVKSVSSSEICVLYLNLAPRRSSAASPGPASFLHQRPHHGSRGFIHPPTPCLLSGGGSFSLAESGIKTRTWNIFGIACSRAVTEAFLKYSKRHLLGLRCGFHATAFPPLL